MRRPGQDSFRDHRRVLKLKLVMNREGIKILQDKGFLLWVVDRFQMFIHVDGSRYHLTIWDGLAISGWDDTIYHLGLDTLMTRKTQNRLSQIKFCNIFVLF